MTFVITHIGKEYYAKNNISGTYDVGLFNESSDNLSESSDIGNINTEPGGASYSRQGTVFSIVETNNDWGIDSDSDIVFDTSDSSSTIDGGFVVVNFNSTQAGDSSQTDHLFFTFELSQSYDLSSRSQLTINAGTAEIVITG